MISYCPRTGKAMHATAAEAAKALMRLANRNKLTKKGSTYRCSHCNAYHFSRLPADAGSLRRAKKKPTFRRTLDDLD